MPASPFTNFRIYTTDPVRSFTNPVETVLPSIPILNTCFAFRRSILPVERMIATTDKPLPDTGERKTTDLQDVTVVSRKPVIKQEDDKSVVDAALSNSSTNAYEVLEKTPGTIVDQDGNVYLSSLTPPQCTSTAGNETEQ